MNRRGCHELGRAPMAHMHLGHFYELDGPPLLDGKGTKCVALVAWSLEDPLRHIWAGFHPMTWPHRCAALHFVTLRHMAFGRVLARCVYQYPAFATLSFLWIINIMMQITRCWCTVVRCTDAFHGSRRLRVVRAVTRSLVGLGGGHPSSLLSSALYRTPRLCICTWRHGYTVVDAHNGQRSRVTRGGCAGRGSVG